VCCEFFAEPAFAGGFGSDNNNFFEAQNGELINCFLLDAKLGQNIMTSAGFQTGVYESKSDFVCKNKLGRSPKQ
jgi:hypothetical protein